MSQPAGLVRVGIRPGRRCEEGARDRSVPSTEWVGCDASEDKPTFASERSDLTVGRFIELVGLHGKLDPGTAYTYASRLRRVVSGIRQINFRGADKFSGGPVPSKWRRAVEATQLSKITPKEITAGVMRMSLGLPRRRSSALAPSTRQMASCAMRVHCSRSEC